MKAVIKTIVIVFFAWLFSFSPSHAYDVVFIGNTQDDAELIRQMEFADQLYGITTKFVLLQEEKETSQLYKVISDIEPHALVIGARTIISLGIEKKLSELINNKITNKKILITGISPAFNAGILQKLSQGKILACQSSDAAQDSVSFQIRNVKNISRELSDQTLPNKNNSIFYLINSKQGNTQSIIDLKINEASYLPVFIKTTLGSNEIFFNTLPGVSNIHKEYMEPVSIESFINIVPLLMFLRYGLGERCWHSSHYYANLTIDDPWLIEPYGNLSFHALLPEMEKANFHTTIAFIPWNYDRSKKDVVNIFFNNPSRFSICIHGNNHDHREFYKYETGQSDVWLNKPLEIQELNIRQALARMEKFKELTGIPYAKIMIFPHNIAPATTLELLKKYNFMATINSSNIPLNSQKPEDPVINFRPISMHFNSFASVKRYGSHRKPVDIAIDLFLGNPLLFHGHHDVFATGIDAFNQTAGITNGIQPHVIWQGLGYIMQHYYLEKLRSDGNYDIEVYSNDVIIENNHNRDVKYYIKKRETLNLPIQEVSVDDRPQSYTASDDNIRIVIPFKKNGVKHIKIKYENNLDINSIEIENKGLRIYILRMFSDFRDITLSKTFLGKKLVEAYYNNNLYKLGLTLIIPTLIVIIFIIFFTFRILLKRKK